MTHLTKEQLKHLAHLSALNLSEDELAKLLPQVENIIAFVGQLDECDVGTIPPASQVHENATCTMRTGVVPCDDTDAILENVHHPLENRMVKLETSTNKVK